MTRSNEVSNFVTLQPAKCLTNTDIFPPFLWGAWIALGEKQEFELPDELSPNEQVAIPTSEYAIRSDDEETARVYLVHESVHSCGQPCGQL